MFSLGLHAVNLSLSFLSYLKPECNLLPSEWLFRRQYTADSLQRFAYSLYLLNYCWLFAARYLLSHSDGGAAKLAWQVLYSRQTNLLRKATTTQAHWNAAEMETKWIIEETEVHLVWSRRDICKKQQEEDHLWNN